MSSSYHNNHDYASPALQAGSKGTLETYMKPKNADDPSPNISGDDKHYEDKDEYKPFPCASPLEKGVGEYKSQPYFMIDSCMYAPSNQHAVFAPHEAGGNPSSQQKPTRPLQKQEDARSIAPGSFAPWPFDTIGRPLVW